MNRKVLKVLELIQFHWCKLIHMFFQNLLPIQSKDMFIISQVHQKTRLSHKKTLRLPQCRLNIFKNSIFFEGAKLWNNLPYEIQSIISQNLFKKSLKQYLLSNQLEIHS